MDLGGLELEDPVPTMSIGQHLPHIVTYLHD